MKRYAVLGEHLPHTISPAIHRAIFALMGIEADYGVLELARSDAPHIRTRLLSDGYAGVNVTIPYKETVIPQLDVLSAEAEEIGAVNTIALENGRLTGYNTDYYGLQALFAATGVDPAGGARRRAWNGRRGKGRMRISAQCRCAGAVYGQPHCR